MLPTLATGLLTGLSLIVAIGAQNAFVLRQGVARHHVGWVVLICAASDGVLIAAGAGGVGAVVERAGWALDVVRWGGVVFLLWYAASSLRRALRPDRLAAGDATAAVRAEPRRAVVGRALALTWLNPHVYLDTVLLLGAVAATHVDERHLGVDGRWWFAAGAMLGSVVWFVTLGVGSRALAPVLARPRAWRVLDGLIAACMTAIAASLLAGA